MVERWFDGRTVSKQEGGTRGEAKGIEVMRDVTH